MITEHKPKHIVVWLPLPAFSSWRGEGIIQTVEHILANAPTSHESPRWTLILSPAHKDEVHRDVLNHPRIDIKTLRGLGAIERKHSYTTDKIISYIKRPTFMQRFTQVIEAQLFATLKRRLDLIRYGVMLTVHTHWQVFGGSFKADGIWIPTPIIPLAHRLRGRKTCSFWDPFIFEYASYRDTGEMFLPQFLRLFQAAESIITQSDYNRRYLLNVMNTPAQCIHVINNGTNDYSRYKIPETVSQGERDEFILTNFGRSDFFGQLSKVRNKFIDQFHTKSVLMRLIERKKSLPNARVIFVSTQFRPHKGMYEMLETATKLIEADDDNSDYLFVFTAKLPQQVVSRYPRLHEHTYELTRLANKDHALIYQLADLVIHPSHAEGGLPYPIHEAASLDVVCLINKGRHVMEAQQLRPELSALIIDIRKPKQAALKIRHVLSDKDQRKDMLAAAMSLERPWSQVAQEYIDCLTAPIRSGEFRLYKE